MSGVLVLNAGSSSLKTSFIDVPQAQTKLICENVKWSRTESLSLADMSDEEIERSLRSVLEEKHIQPRDIVAAGHRVVHGGTDFTAATIVTEAVVEQIKDLCELAPLHNPIALKVLQASRKVLPSIKHFAVFDTAFHSHMPVVAKMYPLPYQWFTERKIMRFGFHGTSHKYCSSRGAALVEKDEADLRIVTCHLGNGSSLAAVLHGTSIDTTMGFTPLEGLMMGSRSGSIDPGIIFHILRAAESVDNLDTILNKQSGLLAVSGIIRDMREIEAARRNKDERAGLAFDMFVRRLVQGIAAMVASLGGVDAVFFTGGIGENSAAVRASTCNGLGFLGVKLDEHLNSSGASDRLISAADSEVAVAVVQCREELAIAEEWIHLR